MAQHPYIHGSNAVTMFPDYSDERVGEDMNNQPKPAGYENWLTTTEAAERLGVNSSQAVVGLIRRRRIIGIKFGTTFRGMWLIDPASIDQYLESKK